VWSRVAIRPSDAPADELPEVEPTAADLMALELGDEEAAQDRVAAGVVLSAYELAHSGLRNIREDLPVAALEPDEDEDLAAVEVLEFARPTTRMRRAAA